MAGPAHEPFARAVTAWTAEPFDGDAVDDLLAQPSAGTLIFEAAAHLADPALLPLLRAFDTSDGDAGVAGL